jgi:hypothetical protein
MTEDEKNKIWKDAEKMTPLVMDRFAEMNVDVCNLPHEELDRLCRGLGAGKVLVVVQVPGGRGITLANPVMTTKSFFETIFKMVDTKRPNNLPPTP